jgi:hypothetical protein
MTKPKDPMEIYESLPKASHEAGTIILVKPKKKKK